MCTYVMNELRYELHATWIEKYNKKYFKNSIFFGDFFCFRYVNYITINSQKTEFHIANLSMFTKN